VISLTREISMAAKYANKEITRSEYYNDLAIKRGFKNEKEYLNYWAQQKGFKDYMDYLNYSSTKKGFKNYNEYALYNLHKRGKCKPFSENKECADYLGIHIAERILSKIFQNVDRMPNCNPGYDFICNKGYKIDVKSACLFKSKWLFHIYNNKIADYFLLLAFDNRTDLNPIHMWLIRNNEIINTRRTSCIINEKLGVTIYNSNYGLSIYSKYEINDKLDKVKLCCNELK